MQLSRLLLLSNQRMMEGNQSDLSQVQALLQELAVTGGGHGLIKNRDVCPLFV